MNARRQLVALGGERSDFDSRQSAVEGAREHPINPVLAVAWAYVASLKRTLPVVLCPLFLAGATTGAWGAEDDPAPRKGVLLLYDENGDFSGLAHLDRSLKASLGRGIPGGIDIYTEYMDISRFRDPQYETKLRDFYRQKYAGKRIDLMVGVMAPSLEFLLEHGEEISPGTPIVFCGIDRRELADRNLPSSITGVLVNREFRPTLETALQLHPHTREVVFIAGTSPFNQYWQDQARGELSALEGRVKITYVNELPMDSLQAKVSQLPSDSIILFLHFFRDGAGKTFTTNEALSLVVQKANVPIYVFFDQFVGSGPIGGFVYSLEAHGTIAAELATRILGGESPSDVPIAEAGSNVYMFDARQLRRWNISEAQLPRDAVVRFPEASFWKLYRWHVTAAITIIIAESMLISALLFQRRRRNLAELAQRKAQAEVQEKQDQLGLAAEAANAAMWVWDVSADDLWMTEQGRALFGFTPDERITFAATMDRVHPEDRAARESAVKRALDTRGGYEIEYRLLEADGVVRWINGRARCVEPNDGSGLKLFGVSIDVTARKQAEASAAQEREELRQKRTQLEHVARVATLGELTTTLTHELKQPLQTIRMSSALGAQMLAAPQPKLQDVRGTFAHIDEITRRAGEMIDRMRDMLKRDTPGFTSLDLNQLIRDVERIVHGDALAHQVTVDLELSTGALPVKADSVQLQQVMLNLMLNAFGAMNKPGLNGAGRLIVRTKSMDAASVLVEVQDSGTGIAPEELDSIFDPFITSKPDGLGIGLSICRSIVERHGGKIWAANNPDRGATFSITLPVAPRELHA
jgi:PAS domain S-box-containing protein